MLLYNVYIYEHYVYKKKKSKKFTGYLEFFKRKNTRIFNTF